MSQENVSPVEQTLQEQKVDPEKGLSQSEAERRLGQFGENCLEEERVSMGKRLLSFFWGPIPWMIEIAAVLAGALERWPDLIMILILLVINAALGFWQEFKADNAMQALKSKLALKARVLRDGSWKEIEAKFLVPGDIAMIKLGNVIPADLQLLLGEYLSVDQSALTGESLPVEKKVGDVAYSGTIAKKGEMIGVVTQTGMNTFFGKTAKLVSSAKTVSHFQEAVLKIGHFLIFATFTVAAVIFIVSIYRMEHDPQVHETFGGILIFLLVLVIAGIPVAMPAVLSMTMAIGASKMAKLQAIVSKLVSIEELAGMNILCSDKTGTLTKNQLTVGDVFAVEGSSTEEVLLSAALASKKEEGDAIDDAIFSQVKEQDFASYRVEKFIPFDPVSKRTEAILSHDGGSFSATKGAVQVILQLAHLDEAKSADVKKQTDEFAAKGFRTLGVAKKEGESWRFLGLIPLFDPPRDDTAETISHTQEMGVTVKMVTGDHVAIAKQVASQISLGTNIYPVEELFSDKIPEKQRTELIEKADGFSQVFPEHKFEIVKHLQEKGHIVGMTGDGVNDAPALKQADIGIAVDNATDAARGAADLILTKPGLNVITKAIEESRRIFGRMKSYAMYRISETIRLLLFLFLAMFFFNTHPLTAIMIILIALLNDIPIMAIAYDNMKIEDKPVVWNMKEVLTVSIGLAVVGVISTFGLYWIGDKIWLLPPDQNRTLAFFGILCGGNLTIYLTRNLKNFWSAPLPEKKFFCATLFSQIVGTLLAVYGLPAEDFLGIGWKLVGLSWVYVAVWFLLCALTKRVLYKILQYEVPVK